MRPQTPRTHRTGGRRFPVRISSELKVLKVRLVARAALTHTGQVLGGTVDQRQYPGGHYSNYDAEAAHRVDYLASVADEHVFYAFDSTHRPWPLTAGFLGSACPASTGSGHGGGHCVERSRKTYQRGEHNRYTTDHRSPRDNDLLLPCEGSAGHTARTWSSYDIILNIPLFRRENIKYAPEPKRPQSDRQRLRRHHAGAAPRIVFRCSSLALAGSWCFYGSHQN